MAPAARRPLAAAATARVGSGKDFPRQKYPGGKHPGERGGHGLPIYRSPGPANSSPSCRAASSSASWPMAKITVSTARRWVRVSS